MSPFHRFVYLWAERNDTLGQLHKRKVVELLPTDAGLRSALLKVKLLLMLNDAASACMELEPIFKTVVAWDMRRLEVKKSRWRGSKSKSESKSAPAESHSTGVNRPFPSAAMELEKQEQNGARGHGGHSEEEGYIQVARALSAGVSLTDWQARRLDMEAFYFPHIYNNYGEFLSRWTVFQGSALTSSSVVLWISQFKQRKKQKYSTFAVEIFHFFRVVWSRCDGLLAVLLRVLWNFVSCCRMFCAMLRHICGCKRLIKMLCFRFALLCCVICAVLCCVVLCCVTACCTQ